MDELPRLVTETPPTYPVRRPEVLEAALTQLRDGAWTRLEGAPETEAALRDYHGGGEVWFVSSGTAALQALLLGHQIGEGDEVITTPYTWGATVSAILAVGSIPVFADIDPRTGLIDPADVARRITGKTRAILGVHLFGWPCDAPALRALADRHGLLFFEDGSQAHGATRNGRRVGRFGHGAAFSCMGLKPLAGTEGGYAIFEDPAAAERAFLYGRHPRGLAPDRVTALGEAGLLDSLQLGWRPCAVSAALVRAALPHLDAEAAARRANAARLREGLRGLPGLDLPDDPPGAEGVYHLLSLLHRPEETGFTREEFLRRTRATGAGGFVYIPVPIHHMKRLNPAGYEGPRVLWHDALRRAGVDYRQVSCPQAEWRAAHSFELGWNWTQENPRAMEQIAEAFRRALQR